MLAISVEGDLKRLKRDLTHLQKMQVPWASALACTWLAKGVQAEEQKEMLRTFDSPTPFTLQSVAVMPATKSNPVAYVYLKEIGAEYLGPYIVGGHRSLGGKKGMLVPKSARVNRYGNLPQNELATLKANPDVFVGPVRTKHGIVRGVWMRPVRLPSAPGTKRRRPGTAPKVRTPLKLMIRFSDTTEVPRRLPYFQRAEAYIKANVDEVFGAALDQAMRTRKQ